MPLATTDISIDGGQISGVVDRGIHVFQGIPYAAPPVGDLRWKPPQPVVPWQGVRDCSTFGTECPQTQYSAGSIYVRPHVQQSEDCLFLNVWTPAAPGEALPVLFWIHGGSLTRGSGISDVRDGVPLAKKGVVLVSINYRLGPLGYLAHPELTAESAHGSSGNYGVLDQIAALQWVQQNIARFGGDASQVTIAGESAGSWSVNTLVASPLARGLFARAIGQSGGRFARTPHLTNDEGMPSAERVGVEFARAAGATTLADLRALPAAQLMDVPGFRTQENVDGWVLPDEIRTIFAEGRHNHVPTMVGSTADEITSFATPELIPSSLDDLRAKTAKIYGPLASEFERVYALRSVDDIARAMLAATRDRMFSLHMRTWARLTVASGAQAFLYYFSYVPPSPRAHELGAFHASELPYVFNVVPSSDPRETGFVYTARDRALADAMSSYWVNFVKTGNPNGSNLPTWPDYDPVTEPYMEFGDEIRAATGLLKAELDFQERAVS